jgi:hypothetical protein
MSNLYYLFIQIKRVAAELLSTNLHVGYVRNPRTITWVILKERATKTIHVSFYPDTMEGDRKILTDKDVIQN